MITREAKRVVTTEVRANMHDNWALHGLTVGHLREFIRQADIADFDDSMLVNISDATRNDASFHDILIESVETHRVTTRIDPDPEGE